MSAPLALSVSLSLVVLLVEGSSTAPRVAPHALGAAPEPWLPLNNGGFTGAPQPLSPDPLVTYVWRASANTTALQLYTVLPVHAELMPGTSPSSFANLASLVGAAANASAKVSGAGAFTVDFGTESAAWVELDSPDLQAVDLPLLSLGFAEWAGEALKVGQPVQYGSTYRLETNADLYEGVRFGYVFLSRAPSQPFTITALRCVSQAKPVNYIGSFAAAGDDLLTKIWYTAVYTVRLNLELNYFGAILVDRGDRISWVGDAHVAQSASMTAFANYAFVLQNLARSATDCNSIESYCVYWALSLMEYYLTSGDAASLELYRPNVDAKLEHAQAIFGNYATELTFFGWDDEVGAGFQNASTLEAQYDFRFLVIRAFRDWAAVLAKTGNTSGAAHWNAYADASSAAIRAELGGDSWASMLGVHASSEALNAPGFATPDEVQAVLAAKLDNAVTICSLSNFNQYWILQALGNAGAMDKAIESIHRCWGVEIMLGGTAFWEISHPDWLLFDRTGPATSVPVPMPFGENGQTSLCHPWSAGAAPWLSKHVAGIAPAAPGFTTVSVAPHITQAMAAAGGLRGSVPTPHGTVILHVDTSAAPAPAVVTLTVPAGCSGGARLLLSEVLLSRLGWLDLGAGLGTMQTSVSVDGGPAVALRVAEGEQGPLYEGELASVERRGLRSKVALLELAPGTKNVIVCVSCVPSFAAAAASPFPPPSWPGRLVAVDLATQGNWLGRYGSQGYALADHGGQGADTVKLPPWLAAVRPVGATEGSWSDPPPASDARALQSPDGAGRAIGSWYSRWSVAVDVFMDASSLGLWWQLAVYVVDYDFNSTTHDGFPPRRGTVALLDGLTLTAAAPVQYVGPEMVGGVWLVFQTNSSARVRASQLQGDNSVISALMFDLVE